MYVAALPFGAFVVFNQVAGFGRVPPFNLACGADSLACGVVRCGRVFAAFAANVYARRFCPSYPLRLPCLQPNPW